MGTHSKPPCAMRARQKTNRTPVLAAAVVSAAAALTAPLARAQSWVGSGGGNFSGTFSTATDWSPAFVPAATSTATFALNQNYTVVFTTSVVNTALVFSNTNGTTTFTDSPANTRAYTLTGPATFNDGTAIFDKLDLNVLGALTVRTDNVLRLINGAQATAAVLNLADSGVGSNGTLSVENAGSQLILSSISQVHPIGRLGNSGTLSFSNSATSAIAGVLQLAADNVAGSKGFLNVLSGATPNISGLVGGASGAASQMAALKVQDAGSILTLGNGAGVGGMAWGANGGPTMTVDVLSGGTLKFNDAAVFTLNPTALMTVNAATVDTVSTPITINGVLTVTNGAHFSQGTAGLSGTPFALGNGTSIGAIVHVGGGTSTTFSAALTQIGTTAPATFDQTGGVVTFDKLLQVANGTYSMAGGSMTVPRLLLGGTALATFNHSGGSVNVPVTPLVNGLTVGVGGGSLTATYNLTGASASLVVGGTLTVGGAAAGSFIQSAGSTTAQQLILGNNAGLLGDYTLGGNALLSATNVLIGLSGVGQLNQNGGTHTATTIQLAQNAGSSGNYQMNSGTLNVQNLNMHGAGDAQFVNSGGTVNVPNGVSLAPAAGGSAFFFQDGPGTLTAFFVDVQGFSGATSSSFFQTTGTVTLAGLSVAGTTASYDMLDGTLQVQFDETITSGAGFAQSAGTHTVNGTLTIGDSASFSLGGGTLSASVVQVLHNGTLSLGGGASPKGNSMTVAGLLEIGSGGSTLTIPTTLLPEATINVRGDLTLASPLTLQGATLFDLPAAGFGPNTLNVQSGVTFSGAGSVMTQVINKGLIEASSGALALRGASLNNTGTLRNASGASLFIDATNLTNSGTVTVNAGFMTFKAPLVSRSMTLAGGTLGTPLLTNTNGGSIRGFGQISGNLDNYAAIEFLGPTQIVGNFTNRAGATLTVRNDQTLITGQSVNNGTITTLNGKVIFDGGLAPAAAVPGAPLGAAAAAAPSTGGGIDGAGTMVLNGASTLVTSYVRQQGLALNGTLGNPAIASVRPKAFGGQTSVLNTLTIPSSGGTLLGRLDLADTALVIDYPAGAGNTPLAFIRAAITSGNHGGDWAGNGITSSSAAANSLTGIGYAEAADVLTFTAGRATFQGQTADTSAVVVRYTLVGDANLDGAVDFLDLAKLAQSYNVTDGARQWTNGDFNYDGNTDFLDLARLAQNYNTALPDALVPGASADFQRDLATAFAAAAAVPEPGALPALLLSGVLLTRLRRRRNLPQPA